MTDKVTLYHRTARGQVKVWSIWYAIEVDTTSHSKNKGRCLIYRRWGMKDGKMQETKEVIKASKVCTAEERMLRMVENHIQSRIEEGYVLKEKGTRQSILIKKADIDFKRLPKEFAPQKPIRELSRELRAQMAGRLMYQRKRDGQRHFILVTDKGGIKVYSRKMEDKTKHVPRLVRALEDLNLPSCSVLDAEMICDRFGVDDFRATGSVCRAGAEVASSNEKGIPLKLMIFDALYYNAQAVWRDKYVNRWSLLHELVLGADNPRIILPETFSEYETALKISRKEKWEGLVIWDLEAAAVLHMNGKAARHGCWKDKPLQEDDFIAVGWMPGKGRLESTMGKLRIAEWQKGKLVEIGTVGSGFDDKDRDRAMRWKYPMVVTLEFDKQELDSRALRFPVFVRVHPDKTVEEMK